MSIRWVGGNWARALCDDCGAYQTFVNVGSYNGCTDTPEADLLDRLKRHGWTTDGRCAGEHQRQRNEPKVPHVVNPEAPCCMTQRIGRGRHDLNCKNKEES